MGGMVKSPAAAAGHQSPVNNGVRVHGAHGRVGT